MKWALKILPWFCVVFFGLDIVAVMSPKKNGEYHVREFGRLPVLLNGRIQPFDSVARNSLLQIRSTGDVPLEQVPSWEFWHHPKKLKSTEWLLEVMARPEDADTRPIFLIHHAELLGELKLQDKGIEKSSLRYYTFNELKPVLSEISDQGQRAEAIKPEEQTTFQKQALKLANAVILYQRLKVTLQPEGVDDFAQELQDFSNDLGPAKAAARTSEKGDKVDEAIQRMAQPLQDFQLMAKFGYPLVVPPLESTTARDNWQNAGACLLESVRQNGIHPAMTYYAAMITAYRQHQPEQFNSALDHYKQWLAPNFQKELRKGRAEFYFNEIKPFLHATIIYIFAFVLACVAVLTMTVSPGFSESFRRSAFYLILLAALVHTFGLIFRMALEGRPPVTNLYSSAVFIGWAAAVLGIILERIYRLGLGALLASFAGFVTLLIAHNLALGGDTMEMLRAVLDTNFWLATHVVVITLGYASTFAAGLLAMAFILLGIFTPLLSHKIDAARSGAVARATVPQTRRVGVPAPRSNAPRELELGKALSKMVYGVACFATLFSFVGTVLGGIWADQSWGRFWGWDPKENGALLIVLWNAIILHARWGGLVRDRGIMNLAVIGNIVTSFSWFGVNLLEIGLHSYGFTDTGAEYLLNFGVVWQLVMLGNGILPLQAWRSFGTSANAAAIGFRKFLACLNVAWLMAALTWFFGVYYTNPSLAWVGKLVSFICLSLVWALGGAARLSIALPSKPQPSLATPPAVPAK